MIANSAQDIFLKSALRLAELGYPILPLKKGGKRPLTEHGSHDATTDLKQIESWWRKWPEANIGLATGVGSGVMAVDVDPSRGGTESLAELESAHGKIKTLEVRTGGGGRHLYFHHVDGIGNRTDFLPGLDVRGEGGYVVAPPSIHESGRTYDWRDERRIAGAPMWLLDAIRKPEPMIPSAPPVSLDDKLERRALAYIESTPPAVSGNGGHSTTFQLATALVHGFRLSDEVAYSLMANHFNPRCEPPWSEKELRHKIDSARENPPSKPSGWLLEEEIHVPESSSDISGLESRNGSCIRKKTSPVLKPASAYERRRVNWLWHQKLALGRLNLLVGMPGVGKSFVTCDLAARVSTGTPWPDGAPCERGSVIMCSAEDDPHDTIRPRLEDHRADLDRVHLLSAVEFFEKETRKERSFTLEDLPILEEAIDQTPDCRLVIVDPVGSYLGRRTDSNRDNEVRSVLAPVAALARQRNLAVLVIAHRRKGGAVEFADDLAIGSRAFTGICRVVWHLMRDNEDKRRRLLLPGKTNLGPEEGGFALTIEGDEHEARACWERDPVAMSADDHLAESQKRGPKPNKMGDATDFLLSYLADGPKLRNDVYDASEERGITARTLERASTSIGVEKQRTKAKGPYIWSLAEPNTDLSPEGF